jgi:pimeloyl-ACP methyl ester carboxylesterase
VTDASVLLPNRHPARRVIQAQGLNLVVHDHGPENGVPVLFLHGFLDTGRSFDATVDELEKRAPGKVRALCLDWRGHGESDFAPPGLAGYAWGETMRDLVLVIRALEADGLAPKLIVGHSMGGALAMTYAAAFPQSSSRLLILDALGPLSETEDQQAERFIRYLHETGEVKPFKAFSSRAAAVARLRDNNPGLSELAAERVAQHALAETATGRFEYRFDWRLRGTSAIRMTERGVLDLLARISVPVRLVRPENGIVPTEGFFAERLNVIKRLSMVEVPAVGHHVHVERPDVIAEEVFSLLESAG